MVLTGKCAMFSQNWFEPVVAIEVVMEKPVPPAKTRSGQELVFPVRISPSRTDLRMRAKKIIA